MKWPKKLLGACASVVLFIIAGCAMITPTVVPPLSEALGYHVPNVGGITTVGMVKSTLLVEREKLRAFDTMASLTLEATEKAKNGILEVMAVLGIGGTSLLPMALSRLPKGAVRKEEHDALVLEALAKDPPKSA